MRRLHQEYVTDLLERDLPDLPGRHRVGGLAGLIELLAARSAGELNIASLARAAGLGERVLPAYIDFFETLYLVDRLPAWSNDVARRSIGRPKVYLADSGLAANLSHLSPQQLDPRRDPRPAGALMETFVVGELRRQTAWSVEPIRLHHFRDRDGHAADVVLAHRDGRIAALEVKAATTVGEDAFATLIRLRDRLGERFVAGVVLYTGTGALSFGDRLTALPVDALWRESTGA